LEPKALKLGVSKNKNIANEAIFLEWKTETERHILENN